ncbi:MAG: UvrB/UvrC motif-containing protein [Syntrophothermus sp.]
MLCDRCQKRPATFYLTRVVNGVKTEMRLCQECAAETGQLGLLSDQLHFMTAPQFTFQNFLAGLLDYGPDFEQEAEVPAQGGAHCHNCGMTPNTFRETGLFGCSECYTDFDRSLDDLLRKIQGSTQHTGKVPLRAGGTVKTQKQIDSLRKELQEAIQHEQYERAAALRDQIRVLESQKGKEK